MPGTSDSKFEAMGPVSVDMAPTLIELAVTPGAELSPAHLPAAAVEVTTGTAPAAVVVVDDAPATSGVSAHMPVATDIAAPAASQRRSAPPRPCLPRCPVPT